MENDPRDEHIAERPDDDVEDDTDDDWEDDWDEPDHGALVAEYSWSNPGGLPAGSGGDQLFYPGGATLVHVPLGDAGFEESELAIEPEGLPATVASWILSLQAEVSAALSQEPLDPNGQLTPQAAKEWRNALGGRLEDLDVAPNIQADVRDQLAAHSERYRRTTRALAEPTSQDGADLLQALLDAQANGSPSALLFGDW